MRRASDFMDSPLLALTPKDNVSIRELCSGALCTGMTGSGKTSGPAAALFRAFLRAGMGGVVTCAKPDDADFFHRLCIAEGRQSSLIIWDGTNAGFNFLGWILAQQGQDGIGNAIEFLMRVLEMRRLASTTPGGTGDQFWLDAVQQVLRASIPVLFAATGTVRVADVLRFVRSAPTDPAQMRDPAWQRESFFVTCFVDAAERLDDRLGDSLAEYWRHDYARLDPKTRGNVVISLTTMLDALNSGWLRRAFCEGSNLFPEACFSGAIIVLNMPALTRHEDGIWAQQIFKYAFQKAVLSRNQLAPAQRQRPVFLLCDEFQLFYNSQDADFLSTCRSSRCCTVLLTQSLPSIYARMGGTAGHDRAHQLIANCATKIWAANNCTTTNSWAADVIGKSVQQRANYSATEGDSSSFGMNMGDGSNWGTSATRVDRGWGGVAWRDPDKDWNANHSVGGNNSWGRNRGTSSNSGTSQGYSEQIDYVLRPDAFSRMLKTGGPACGNRVSAVWHQAGRTFQSSSGNALLTEFAQ